MANVGMTATAGVGNFKHPPKNYEEMHPGAYDAAARLEYMDQMGIWAMVMYPNVGGFGAQQFLKLNDPELMLTCVQIYNDWQTEWASADSRRLLPITSLPFWDVAAAVKEVRRCAAMGHKGILFTGEPQSFGQAAARAIRTGIRYGRWRSNWICRSASTSARVIWRGLAARTKSPPTARWPRSPSSRWTCSYATACN